VLFWVGGFDVIYALQDEEFDRANGLHSIPSWLGKAKALRMSEAFHALTALFITAAGIQGGFGPWYWVGAALFLGLLVYQHTIVKPNDLSRVNLAFMTANGMASVAFAAFVIADQLLNRNTLA
jgi:4-hydroxybenzoate polyprenyltransferase